MAIGHHVPRGNVRVRVTTSSAPRVSRASLGIVRDDVLSPVMGRRSCRRSSTSAYSYVGRRRRGIQVGPNDRRFHKTNSSVVSDMSATSVAELCITGQVSDVFRTGRPVPWVSPCDRSPDLPPYDSAVPSELDLKLQNHAKVIAGLSHAGEAEGNLHTNLPPIAITDTIAHKKDSCSAFNRATENGMHPRPSSHRPSGVVTWAVLPDRCVPV